MKSGTKKNHKDWETDPSMYAYTCILRRYASVCMHTHAY